MLFIVTSNGKTAIQPTKKSQSLLILSKNELIIKYLDSKSSLNLQSSSHIVILEILHLLAFKIML